MSDQATVDKALDDLAQRVTAMTDASTAAVEVLNSIAGRIQAALDAYRAANPTVTDAQVSGLQAEITGLQSATDSLAAATVANTSAGPTP